MSYDDISSVYYLDGVAVSRDFAFLATQLNSLDPRKTAHTRCSTYNPSEQTVPFGYFDLEDNIVSVHAYRVLPEDKKRFVCLGSQGTVHFVRGSTREVRTEHLPGAGFLDGNFGGLMCHITEINGQLWTCGQQGQVYRRYGVDDWRRADQGIRLEVDPQEYGPERIDEMLAKLNSAPFLTCMDGTGGSDVYVVGLQGFIAHFDGSEWTRIHSPVDDHLEWVRCIDKDEVWICGHNGALLKGSAKSGFKSLGGMKGAQKFVCVDKFKGSVYLSAEEGLFVYDGDVISVVDTSLQPNIQDAWRLDQADGVMWSIGVKDLVRFDGEAWSRIQHPDNTPIE